MRRLALFSLLFVLACDDGGPEFLGGDTRLIFPGSLTAEESEQDHDFDLTSSGTIEVLLEEISAVAADTGEPIDNPELRVAIGRPREGVCAPTRVALLGASESFIVFLTPAAFCLRVERSVILPTDSMIEYQISVTPALS